MNINIYANAYVIYIYISHSYNIYIYKVLFNFMAVMLTSCCCQSVVSIRIS